MKIEPSLQGDKNLTLNQLFEEVYRFIEELEQQVRGDIHRFQQGIEPDQTTTSEAQPFGNRD